MNIFHNYGLPDLADHLGKVAAAIRGLELRKRALQEELERRGVVTLIGHEWQVKRSKFDRLDPDREKLRAELGERYETEFCKTVPVTRWACTAVDGGRKAA